MLLGLYNLLKSNFNKLFNLNPSTIMKMCDNWYKISGLENEILDFKYLDFNS